VDGWDTGTDNERGIVNGKDILWYRKYKSKNALGSGWLKQEMLMSGGISFVSGIQPTGKTEPLIR
jgi:hypothetical protein